MLDHLQGAYIGMKKGTTPKLEVVAFESIEQLFHDEEICSLSEPIDLIKDKSQYYLETSFDAIGNNFIIRYSYDSKKTIQIKELSNFYKFEDELIKIIDSME